MEYILEDYYYIDAKNHEKISGDMLYQDSNLRKFFTEDEMLIMKDAIYDHRASSSNEPRTIYGMIVSSADRNISIESTLKRTYAYRLKHNPNAKNILIHKPGPLDYDENYLSVLAETYYRGLMEVDKWIQDSLERNNAN